MLRTSHLLTLDSSNVPDQPSDNFTIPYPNIELPGEWVVALQKLYCWYSYFNISSELDNNTIRYSTDNGSTWEADLVVPGGIYSIEDLNSYIQGVMKTRGHWNSPAYNLALTFSSNLLKCEITLTGGYQWDLSVGNLYYTLGFTKAIVTATAVATGGTKINNGINSILVQCDLTSSGWQNQYEGGTVATFVPETSPGASISIAPSPPIYLPVNKSLIHSVRIKIVDQLNRRINFNGETVTAVVHLKRVA